MVVLHFAMTDPPVVRKHSLVGRPADRCAQNIFFFTCISLVEGIYTENDLKYLRYDEQAVVDQIRHTDTCDINFYFQKSRYVNKPMGSKNCSR